MNALQTQHQIQWLTNFKLGIRGTLNRRICLTSYAKLTVVAPTAEQGFTCTKEVFFSMADSPDSEDNVLTQKLAFVLERRRQEVGISQEELARRAGISRTYLSDIERGLRNISVGTLHKLASAMGILPSKLLATAEAEILVVRSTE